MLEMSSSVAMANRPHDASERRSVTSAQSIENATIASRPALIRIRPGSEVAIAARRRSTLTSGAPVAGVHRAAQLEPERQRSMACPELEAGELRELVGGRIGDPERVPGADQ